MAYYFEESEIFKLFEIRKFLSLFGILGFSKIPRL